MATVLRNCAACVFAVLCVIFSSAGDSYAGRVTLQWDVPTTNEDGTPLTDLAGYKIYYGPDPGNYSGNIDAGNVTTYQVHGLTEGATYYFAVTAYDYAGNESVHSNAAVTTVPYLSLPDISVTDSVVPKSDLQVLFGNVTEGNVSEETVSVTNRGSADLVLGSITQGSGNGHPFSILDDYCSGQTVSPSSGCALIVRFSPPAVGQFSDSLSIPSNDPDENPVIVSISGAGLSSGVNNPPDDPVLDSPVNRQKGLGKKVGFKWKKSRDPDGDTVSYELNICEDAGLTTGCMSEIDIALHENEKVSYAGMVSYGTGLLCFLTVSAMSGMTRYGRRKAVCLVGVIFVSGILIISCGGGGGGSGGAVGVSESGPATESSEVVHEVSGLKSATTYYWAVTARDGNGGESTSEVRSFQTG